VSVALAHVEFARPLFARHRSPFEPARPKTTGA
jgi:hypothetical protein